MKNGFLKVTGILMIIGGALGIVLGIIAIVGVAALALLGGNSGLLTISAILAIVSAIVQLIAGIKGVKGSNDAALGAKCFPWGIIVIVLTIIGQVLGLIGGSGFNVINWIVGLVIPVLYLIGAIKAKKELG